MAEPFVTTIDLSLSQKLKDILEEKGFVLTQPNYTIFTAKSKNLSCTLYQSGKLVVQGKESKEFIEFILEPEILQSFDYSIKKQEQDLRPRIGVDESGKGDFFGPLCIASVFIPTQEAAKQLYLSPVQDSKNLSDNKILSLAPTIRSLCISDVIILYPEKYNSLYSQFNNLNKLLAWGHATVIDNIAPKPPKDIFAISDQFASSKDILLQALKKKASTIELIQRTKAESDIAVAAASILAREAFIKAVDKLEKQFQVKLPKGASHKVKEQGRHIFLSQGLEILKKVSKTHFKTFLEIINS